MPSTFLIAPNPKWNIFDAFGVLAAGGTMKTFSSLDHSTPKFVFSDPTGIFPYVDPIILDATGGTPVPIYWEINGIDLYYVVVSDANGNIIFTIDNYPMVGGGGSTPITSNIDIENHIVNGAFLFIDAPTTADSVVTPIPNEIRIAPASGYFKDTAGAYVPVWQGNASGWLFGKAGGAGETSSIRFVDVVNIGEGFPNAPSANATRFFRYSLTATGAVQTENFLFQTIPNVEAFSNETLTISLDIHSNANGIGFIEVLQYYGSGGSATTNATANFNFVSGDWSRITVMINVPSVVGKVKGVNGDDSIQIRIHFPLNAIGSFDVTNIQLQRGTFASPAYIYQDYNQDQYKVLIDLMTFGNAVFQTGDYIFSDNAARPGWLLIFNDAEAIGKTAASLATSFGIQYQNLYVLWWSIYNQTECPVNGGRGVSALADFNADKRMGIPQLLVNHVIGIAGNAIPFGFVEGDRENVLAAANLPPHNHSIAFADSGTGTQGGDGPPGVEGTTITGAGPGVSAPFSIMQPTHYKNLFVKL